MKTRIPIKRYVDDPSLTWEERYARLLAHHEDETKFLIATIEELEAHVHAHDNGLRDGFARALDSSPETYSSTKISNTTQARPSRPNTSHTRKCSA